MIYYYRKNFIIATGVMLVLFVLFIVVYENMTFKIQKRRLEAQSNYLAEYFWNLDQEGATRILEKVLNIENLNSALITHNNGEVFVRLKNENYKPYMLDGLLGSLYLLRKTSIEIPVTWKGENIGVLRTSWINHNFYVYLCIGVFCALLGIIYAYHFAFRERGERYKELVENANSAIVRWSKQGEITFINEFAEDFFGYKKQEIIGRPVVGTIIPATETTGRDLKQIVKDISRSPEMYEAVVLESQRKNGERVWLNWTHKRFKDSKTEETNIFSIGSDITEQKKAETELKQTQRELIDVARMAGKAEVAISVLHNVGNILNSVNTSISTLKETNQGINLDNFIRALNLLEQHQDDLNEFTTKDPQGKLVFSYLSRICTYFKEQQQETDTALNEMAKHISHITDIISVQQTNARSLGMVENADICKVVEDTLKVDANMIFRHNIALVRQFEDVPLFMMDRHKVIQIMLNLFKNAIDSLLLSDHEEKKIVVNIKQLNDTVIIEVADNGVGVDSQHMDKLFSYGFTTKKDGHGFGLHGSANFAKEMGGELTCRSQGVGEGAAFCLMLPMKKAEDFS
jgi:PAS domain S-box-containing protein